MRYLSSVLLCCWLGSRKGIQPVKDMGGWWRWALVSPDGVAPGGMASVSASVNLPLHHKVQKFSSGTGSPGWSQKRGHKMVVVISVFLWSSDLTKLTDWQAVLWGIWLHFWQWGRLPLSPTHSQWPRLCVDVVQTCWIRNRRGVRERHVLHATPALESLHEDITGI